MSSRSEGNIFKITYR